METNLNAFRKLWDETEKAFAEKLVELEEYPDGFYHLYSPSEKEPVLVHCYYCEDSQCRGFGFNIYDGGGFLPLSDLTDDTSIIALDIEEQNMGTQDLKINGSASFQRWWNDLLRSEYPDSLKKHYLTGWRAAMKRVWPHSYEYLNGQDESSECRICPLFDHCWNI